MTSPHFEKNKAFYEFLETQLQLFKGHLLVTKASKDEEAIHQMRVAIKRIRTIQKLKKNISITVEIPQTVNDAIKTIFHSAGKLRDLQIHLNLLHHFQKEIKTSFNEFNDYLTHLATELNELIDQTIHKINFSGIDELPLLPDKGYENDIEKECIDFVERKIKKINELILLILNEEEVHELRKQIKQLFFILQFLSEQMPDNLFFGYEMKNLKRLTDAIGNWNDRDFFGKRMDKFLLQQQAGFVENSPEYVILKYLNEHQKRTFLEGIDVDIYLEMINLQDILRKRNQPQPAAIGSLNAGYDNAKS